MSLKLNVKYAGECAAKEKLKAMRDEVSRACAALRDGTGPGAGFLGWAELPFNYDRAEFEEIRRSAEKIRKNSDVLLVLSIGGSYLGSRAVIEFIKSNNYNLLRKDSPEIYFGGNGMSSAAADELIRLIGDRDFSINVISKSGTTIETALAFRIFRKLVEEKYGEKEAAERIYVTTDKTKGALRALAGKKGYKTFSVPDDVGGRYSVLTAVGLLPIAAAGVDIDALMEGAAAAAGAYSDDDVLENDCCKYAAVRNALYRAGKKIEILAAYEPSASALCEWFKQLFGESEGKNGKGIYPSSAIFSTDLHSLGQYIQQGERNLFETVVWVEEPASDVEIAADPQNGDGLNFLAGKTLHYVNKKAFEGALIAHSDGGVPNVVIEIEKRDERNLGELIYFFERACGISGYILGVNPFDQPGVESYKKNMFALLGKPGYEKAGGELEKRLK